jgi:hypothetical protein
MILTRQSVVAAVRGTVAYAAHVDIRGCWSLLCRWGWCTECAGQHLIAALRQATDRVLPTISILAVSDHGVRPRDLGATREGFEVIREGGARFDAG